MVKTKVAVASGVAAAAALAGSAGVAEGKATVQHIGTFTSPLTGITYTCNFVTNNAHPNGFYSWDPDVVSPDNYILPPSSQCYLKFQN